MSKYCIFCDALIRKIDRAVFTTCSRCRSFKFDIKTVHKLHDMREKNK